MDDYWLNKWNDRYSKQEYAYGTQPNEYLKEQLPKLSSQEKSCLELKERGEMQYLPPNWAGKPMHLT